MLEIEWEEHPLLAANNGEQGGLTPQRNPNPQQKSSARQQCEANAQARINSINSTFWSNAATKAKNDMFWGIGVGCAVTWEAGCGDGAMAARSYWNILTGRKVYVGQQCAVNCGEQSNEGV